MGNGGSKYEPPPPTPMPIEDDLLARQEASALLAQRMTTASRNANDLLGDKANKIAPVTRKQVEGPNDKFAPQPQPRGPKDYRARGPKPMAPGSLASQVNSSAVLTG
jgi:hypothetical protein